jgi:hypothetical protein
MFAKEDDNSCGVPAVEMICSRPTLQSRRSAHMRMHMGEYVLAVENGRI